MKGRTEHKPPTKPSGIPWLGEVPAHWEVKRLGDHVHVVNGYPFDAKLFGHEGEWPLIRVRDVLSGSTETYWQGDVVHEALVDDGDLLVGMDGDFHIGEWNSGPAMLNQRVCCVRTLPTLDKRYLYYLLPYPIKVINDLTYATTVKHLSSFDIASIRFPLPPLPEQRAIAAFLDERTARIDALVARKRRLVQLLKEKRQALITRAVTRGLDPKAKMKESGVPWLGVVPEGWEVKRFKHVVTVWGRIGFRGYTVDDLVDEGNGALALGASHITADGGVDINEPVFLSWEKYYESPEIMIAKDDLIVVQRGSVGKVAHVDRDLGPATINPSLVLLKNAKANPRFLLYVLLGGYIQSTITTLLNATAVPMLSQQQVGNFDLLLPPSDEQDQIVEYIDRETARIDALVTKVEQAVERLQEYRTALISAAVTGKVRVPMGRSEDQMIRP